MTETLDPILLAIVQNRLDHIAQEMGDVMIRASRSPIFNESHDFSCFLTDADGNLVSQADGIPIHTGGGGFIVKAIFDRFRGAIADGDVFISSDPYVAGGNHLPDWVVTRPVFVAGRPVAFVCNRAHQSDIGGGAAGTYNPAATEIFHEGIRIPPMRLEVRGERRDDLWEMLLLNTRCPDLVDGDLSAMLGSTVVGARRIRELVSEVGLDRFPAYVAGIFDHAERRMRAALAAFPDGVYAGAEKTDNDCFQAIDLWIRVTVTKTGDRLKVDFTGTDPQMKGFKNSTFVNSTSAVYVAVTSFFDHEIPRNHGTYRPVEIVLPRGTMVNPNPPAPQTMSTVLPSHEIIHAVWMALGQGDPARACAGWGKICHCNMAGPTPGGSTYVMYHWGALPAAGAVDGRDGFDQIGPLNSLGKLVVPNCETYEQIYPVHFLRHELRCDGGGAGRFRGGTGVDYAVEVREPAEYAFRGEGMRTAYGFGVGGGMTGAAGSVRIDLADGTSFDPPQFGVGRLGAARITIEAPGGGGWGDPRDRDVDLVLRDVLDELVSPAAARADYGVALTADGRGVDVAETERLRATTGGSR